VRASIDPPMGWLDWRVQEPSQEEDDGGWCSLECLEEKNKKRKVEASNFGDRNVATYHHDCVGCAEDLDFQSNQGVEGIAN
jgi:hypothetical protein